MPADCVRRFNDPSFVRCSWSWMTDKTTLNFVARHAEAKFDEDLLARALTGVFVLNSPLLWNTYGPWGTSGTGEVFGGCPPKAILQSAKEVILRHDPEFPHTYDRGIPPFLEKCQEHAKDMFKEIQSCLELQDPAERTAAVMGVFLKRRWGEEREVPGGWEEGEGAHHLLQNSSSDHYPPAMGVRA